MNRASLKRAVWVWICIAIPVLCYLGGWAQGHSIRWSEDYWAHHDRLPTCRIAKTAGCECVPLTEGLLLVVPDGGVVPLYWRPQ